MTLIIYKRNFLGYIELKRQQGCKLYVDNKELDNSKVIKDRDIRQYAYNNITYDVTFCRWNRKLNKEFSKYYYIDSNGIEQYKENTTLNNKGDKFYHSVYIKSSLFNEFNFEETSEQVVCIGNTRHSDDFKYIKKKVDKLLREKRNPFIKEYTKTYLSELNKNGAYPQYKDTLFDEYRKEALDSMISSIFYAEPKCILQLKYNTAKNFY